MSYVNVAFIIIIVMSYEPFDWGNVWMWNPISSGCLLLCEYVRRSTTQILKIILKSDFVSVDRNIINVNTTIESFIVCVVISLEMDTGLIGALTTHS